MLTSDEARAAIKNNDESNLALVALRPREWTYVRDPEVEARSQAAFLIHGRTVSGSTGRLEVGSYGGQTAVSGVVVLRDNRRVAAQKVDPALVSNFRAVVSKLDAAAQAGVLEPSIASISMEVLRRIE